MVHAVNDELAQLTRKQLCMVLSLLLLTSLIRSRVGKIVLAVWSLFGALFLVRACYELLLVQRLAGVATLQVTASLLVISLLLPRFCVCQSLHSCTYS